MDPTPLPADPRAGESAIAAQKAALRARLNAARRARPETPQQVAGRTARALDACVGHESIACYGSIGAEPDSWPLIHALAAAGVRVLLPVLSRTDDGRPRRHPDWAWFTGDDSLRRGLWGIAEPTGPTLGPEGLAEVGFIWTSALAVTPTGLRLGAGGGWYDRALAWAAEGVVVGTLVRDDEVISHLPVEAWDRRVDLIATERRTLTCSE